ncbi:MAG: type II secretion system protein [Pirellulaceae bacterium]|nr:type II secretion system protein [Pirellulaceae bacterium]
MGHRSSHRRGMSLLELIAVVTLMGVFAAVAIARLGPTVFGDIGSQTDARRVGLALLQAKRRAITAGNNHGVLFQNDGGGKLTYSVVSIDPFGSTSLVDGPFSFSQNVTATVSQSTMSFTFEGQASASYTVDLVGPHKSWRISVVPISGALSTVQTAP